MTIAVIDARHGTLSGWVEDGCRCWHCRNARGKAERKARTAQTRATKAADLKVGDWVRTVPGEPLLVTRVQLGKLTAIVTCLGCRPIKCKVSTQFARALV